jgi:hypothetical protein
LKQRIKTIFNQFETGTSPVTAERIGSGHIHQTYKISVEGEHHPGYILQQFNRYVFPDHHMVMNNTLMVTDHLLQSSDFGKHYRVARPVIGKSGQYYVTEQDGTTWRLFHRIAPGLSFDAIPGEAVAHEAGKIYGRFLAALRGLPVSKIQEVIPGFHLVELRFSQLTVAVDANVAGRLAEVRDELRVATKYIDTMRIIPREQQNGNLPLRVTHNDTKLNNILFDRDHRAMAVVDLDTVMPGLSLFDFGDLVRTAANTGSEDGPGVGFSLPLYTEIARGFLEEAGEYLTPVEIKLLPFAPQYMAYIMGIRFLADYINGDVYYTIHHPQQNLERCRAQFKLMQCMMESGIAGDVPGT